jgi:hypothetical protein
MESGVPRLGSSRLIDCLIARTGFLRDFLGSFFRGHQLERRWSLRILTKESLQLPSACVIAAETSDCTQRNTMKCINCNLAPQECKFSPSPRGQPFVWCAASCSMSHCLRLTFGVTSTGHDVFRGTSKQMHDRAEADRDARWNHPFFFKCPFQTYCLRFYSSYFVRVQL